MANHVFNVPDIGEGTAVAELASWYVQVGDLVEEDQPLADLITDKATVEIPSPTSGRVVACHGKVGEELAVGSPFVEFESGSDERVANAANAPATKLGVEIATPDATPAPLHEQKTRVGEGVPMRPMASPAVRQRALDLGIDLSAVRGSGPAGRVRHSDLETYLTYHPTDPIDQVAGPNTPKINIGPEDVTEVPLIGLRRKIAQKMEISTRSIPHFSYMEEFDMSALETIRERLNTHYAGSRTKLTMLPFLIVALCRVLPAFPQINAVFDEAAGIIRQHRGIHIGIATQTPAGLIVPVIRHAERRGLWELANEIRQLSTGARDGNLARDKLSGSTITITSLGRLGGIVTTPVINHPEVAIIGPNNIIERPVACEGAIVLRKMMNMSSSFDHRVVDGYDAALFVQAIKALIEEPALLLAA
jgi:2-oxoisovalerate dehydrogenase E2 component (dihydrolipoyl transacylase)